MAKRTVKPVPKHPLDHIVLTLKDYFGSRGGHGITGEVAGIFADNIEDSEVQQYCAEEYGQNILTIAQAIHKNNLCRTN